MKILASTAISFRPLTSFLLLLATAVLADAQDRPQEAQLQLARQAWEMAADEGWIEGIRDGDLIRPDLLSATIDGGILGALDPGNKAGVAALGDPADFQKPEAFTISSPTDPNYREPVHPTDVGRTSYEGRNCMNAKTMWPLFVHTIHWHDFFLYLPKPLQSGHTYVVHVETKKERDARFKYEWRIDYDDAETTSKVIKINQVSYSAMAKRRYAYLGWWAGDRGTVKYPGLDRFEIVDEKTGQTVHQGPITLRESNDVNSGEDVYQLDLSSLRPGQYHIHVPGFARSETFRVGGAGTYELYYHTMRAFFHQRCGQEFREPWTWVRKPACHTEIWESGNFVAGPGAIHHSPGNRDEHAHYEPKPNETKRSLWGGYHDAADFDTFAYHLPATDEAAYRMGNGRGTACGWGACQGANHGDLLLRAYILTDDQKYLDAACLNADWHLGTNPLSKTLLTGMGYRFPRRPEISWFLYEEPERDMSGSTVKGIAIYGIGPPLRLHTGDRWPLWRSWRDVWDRFAEIYSEFTVPQTCGPAAILYATLYGMEKEVRLIPDGSKPDPLGR